MQSFSGSETRRATSTDNQDEDAHGRILKGFFSVENQESFRPATVDEAGTAVYEPFDGSLLGTLQPPDQNTQPDEVGTSNSNSELWTHLSAVMDLQLQISRMHLEMEEVGLTDSKAKGKSRSRATSVSRVVIDDVGGRGGGRWTA
ncbi:hypothetical protein MKEN_00832700 [Mycena kentingensis (nom. inval.)]|nr:hypothetical protein MKEN_00832700 [Mycena kentingensis (nom. inval.)]